MTPWRIGFVGVQVYGGCCCIHGEACDDEPKGCIVGAAFVVGETLGFKTVEGYGVESRGFQGV